MSRLASIAGENGPCQGELEGVHLVPLLEVSGKRVCDTPFGVDVPPGRTNVTVLV
ncbi:MAG: hypothetical protein VX317_01870 [Verrucomicrobiota bacterium]|nr:hypothetical protein [Verrucomicrobiota bacterium]